MVAISSSEGTAPGVRRCVWMSMRLTMFVSQKMPALLSPTALAPGGEDYQVRSWSELQDRAASVGSVFALSLLVPRRDGTRCRPQYLGGVLPHPDKSSHTPMTRQPAFCHELIYRAFCGEIGHSQLLSNFRGGRQLLANFQVSI